MAQVDEFDLANFLFSSFRQLLVWKVSWPFQNEVGLVPIASASAGFAAAILLACCAGFLCFCGCCIGYCIGRCTRAEPLALLVPAASAVEAAARRRLSGYAHEH